MPKQAVLMVNLGSPDSTSVPDVRRYLAEFLYDERVLDSPAPVRWTVLNLFILPRRPANSAKAYSRVWQPEGSPLIITSKRQRQLVQDRVDVPVHLAMRYGSPSIKDVMTQIIADGVERLLLMPMYPHYAMSSYETVVVRVMEEVNERAPQMKVELLQPFYNEADYLDALVESARPYLEGGYDKILFSFHGIPERHLRKSDPSHYHCLCTMDCCNSPHPAHSTCYRHQCFNTVKGFVERTGIPADAYFTSFQSRLGRTPWLTPYTDHTLIRFANEGVKKLLVICPSFVADCLETLEEISMAGKESFEKHGGEELIQIPCLNEHPAFIDFLVKRVKAWQAQNSVTGVCNGIQVS